MTCPGYAQLQENGGALGQMLPEHTLAVGVFPNLDHTAQHLSQIPLVAQILTAQPDPLLSILRQRSAELTETLAYVLHGISLAELGSIFHRSCAIAVLDENPATFPENLHLPGPVVFLADVTDTAERLQDVIETRLIPAIQAQEESVVWGVESFAGTDVYSIANQQFQVYYTFFHHLFILTFQQNTLHDLLISSQNMLTTSPHRMALERYLQEPQDAWVYINLHRLQQRLHALIPQGCPVYASLFQAILKQFNWETLLWTVAYREYGGYERLFLGMEPGPHERAEDAVPLTTGLWRAGNDSFASSRFVPANTIYYRADRINFSELWQQIIRMIPNNPDLRQQNQLTSHIQTIETMLHLDIETDILPILGQEVATIWLSEVSQKSSSKRQSDVAIPCAWLIRISDYQQFDVVWPKLWTALQIQPVNTIMHGIPVQTIRLAEQLAPLTLYTTRIADFLVVSLSETGLQEILRVAHQGSPLANFLDQGYSTGYVNLTLAVKGVHQFLEQHAAATTLRPDQLVLTALAREFMTGDERRDLVWMTTVVEEGFLTESYSPVGGTALCMLIAWLGWTILQ